MRHVASWIRPVATGLILAVGLAVTAPPAHAAQSPSPEVKQPTLTTSAEARVAASAALAAQATAAPAGSESSTGFFKTKKGVAVLVLLAGVVTWTAVSRSRDAIHSPGRK